MYFQILPDEARVVTPSQARLNAFAARHLEIRMFHVGHGECILVVFPNNNCWLVDCGSGTRSGSNEALARNVVNYLVSNGLQLDAIVATHPHSDHAMAFTTILNDPSPNIANRLTIYRSNDPGWFDRRRQWLPPYHRAVAAFGDEQVLEDERLYQPIAQNIWAQLFAGSVGRRFYISIFMQLGFHDARILFTGDAYKPYEIDLRDGFGAQYFNADVLKITHHGSADGTDEGVLRSIRPGIAFASTGRGGRHQLERITRANIRRGHPQVRVYETYRNQQQLVNERDIILTTDGLPINGAGVLYRRQLVAPAFGE